MRVTIAVTSAGRAEVEREATQGEEMSNGKGSKRRPGKPGAYEQGYDLIRWKSKKKHPAQD